jgi:hypothetical protein
MCMKVPNEYDCCHYKEYSASVFLCWLRVPSVKPQGPLVAKYVCS